MGPEHLGRPLNSPSYLLRRPLMKERECDELKRERATEDVGAYCRLRVNDIGEEVPTMPADQSGNVLCRVFFTGEIPVQYTAHFAFVPQDIGTGEITMVDS